MSNGESTALSDDEKRLLRHELFISEVLSARTREPAKSNWAKFLQSAGGAALITVVVGGLFTTLVASLIQRGAKDREFQNELIKVYGEHRLGVQKEFLEGRARTMTAALELVGRVRARSKARIDIDGPSFAIRMDPIDHRVVEDQKKAIRSSFNVAEEEWDTRKETLSSLIKVYFGSKSSIEWARLSKALDEFAACASAHRPSPKIDACHDSEGRPLESALQGFTHAIQTDSLDQTWMTKEEVAQIRKLVSQ